MNSACLFVKFIEWNSILHNSFIQQIFFEYFYMPNTAPGAGEPAAGWRSPFSPRVNILVEGDR